MEKLIFSKRIQEVMGQHAPKKYTGGKWHNRPYDHICIDKKYNFIDGQFPEKCDIKGNHFGETKRIKYHEGAAHLNSSQVMCISFFKKFFENPDWEKYLIMTLQQVGVPVPTVQIKDAIFEYEPDPKEKTNFDFYMILENGVRVSIEVKYTEAEFGGISFDQKDPDKYARKWQDLYKGMVDNSPYLSCIEEAFFAQYQINRNICYAWENDIVLFLTPRANDEENVEIMCDKNKIQEIRILPSDKTTFQTEEEFSEFIKKTMILRGGYYYFPTQMMKCRANTFVLFQYDGMIRATGLLIDSGKKDIVDEKGGKYAGYYQFDINTLHYLESPLDKEYVQQFIPTIKGFSQTKHIIPMQYLDAVFQMLTEKDKYYMNRKEINFDHNTILYGPPGTGKTYSTARYAVQICDGSNATDLDDYDSVMKRYRQLMNEEHRISFVTFHQSYGYEEFIEGIKPLMAKDVEQTDKSEIKYDIVDGIFKSFCNRARKEVIHTEKFSIPDTAKIWKATVRSEVEKDCFQNNRIRIDWAIDSNGAYGFVNDIHEGDIILTTDGSRSIINGIAIAIDDEAYCLDTEHDKTTRDVQWLAKGINEDIVVINSGKILHRKTVSRAPGMAVGDIIQVAVKHNPELQGTQVIENSKPYVFIIDEINRGNISKIFGELITLIEDTKREGMKECIPAVLPYSNTSFTVPQNVYILGTMNTADRSIALMDTALRRRFSFIEMEPRPELLDQINIIDNGVSVNIGKLLSVMNKRITHLYDREHTIGHAPFMKLINNPSIELLAGIFAKTVIPLLQEYFYEDYSKIRMILGDNAKISCDDQFIIESDLSWDNDFLGEQPDEIDIPERTYEIRYENFKNIRCYKGIIEIL